MIAPESIVAGFVTPWAELPAKLFGKEREVREGKKDRIETDNRESKKRLVLFSVCFLCFWLITLAGTR